MVILAINYESFITKTNVKIQYVGLFDRRTLFDIGYAIICETYWHNLVILCNYAKGNYAPIFIFYKEKVLQSIRLIVAKELIGQS